MIDLRGQQYGMTSKLNTILSDLDAQLASTLLKDSDGPGDGAGGRPNLGLINSFSDEYNFWAEEAQNTSNSSHELERAIFFCESLKPLKGEFDKLR